MQLPKRTVDLRSARFDPSLVRAGEVFSRRSAATSTRAVPPGVTPATRHRIVSEPRWSELAPLLPVVECISNVSYLTADFNGNFMYMNDYAQ